MGKIEKLIQLRNDIFAWAKIELKDTVVCNTDANMEILINMRGLKHTLKGKSYKKIDLLEKNEATIMSIKYLKYFLETSKYMGFEEDKKQRDNILGVHIFASIFSYKNMEYNVKILVRETQNKTFFYDQALIQKNNPTTGHLRVSG